MNVTEVCVVMGNVGVLKQSLTNCDVYFIFGYEALIAGFFV